MKELIEIQTRLKAPKSNEAKGQNGRVIYKYRSCEDILESLKGLLKELKCTITVTDEVVLVGNRIYIKATATLTNENGDTQSTSAFAREPEQLATMNQAQVTGATSSYARKYALNGLLAIDDTKDADTVHDEQPVAQPTQPQEMTAQEYIRVYIVPEIEQAQTAEDLTKVFNQYVMYQGVPEFMSALSNRRKALGIRKSNE